ncbi:cytochrome b [Sphingomonas fennica]|uniref:Cytochrome B n=1 Tax=Edaphosphingomonas fennica TaxID=114404 RepID=A0A2T4HLY3_9SPHN|nr:cytochrome b [Sphingomonas fennica]PTD16787.1 cytochrome B [Sphingomonas fennica]
MNEGNPPSRYTLVAIVLHWALAAGIVALIVMGMAMTKLDLPILFKFKVYQLHKSIGITVLLLAVLRLGWRIWHPAPALPATMSRNERLLAHAGHWVLYLLQFAVPLLGWAVVSAAVLNIPTLLYGVVPWPHLPLLSTIANRAQVEPALATTHALMAYGLVLIVVGHVAAALRHHLVLKDDVLARMIPGLRQRPGKDEPAASG